MEPMVLRRPLMAKVRRNAEANSRGDCRIITITLISAVVLGAVVFASYPGPGPTTTGGAGLLANIQDQATTLLGGHPKTETPGSARSVGVERKQDKAATGLQAGRTGTSAKTRLEGRSADEEDAFESAEDGPIMVQPQRKGIGLDAGNGFKSTAVVSGAVVEKAADKDVAPDLVLDSGNHTFLESVGQSASTTEPASEAGKLTKGGFVKQRVAELVGLAGRPVQGTGLEPSGLSGFSGLGGPSNASLQPDERGKTTESLSELGGLGTAGRTSTDGGLVAEQRGGVGSAVGVRAQGGIEWLANATALGKQELDVTGAEAVPSAGNGTATLGRTDAGASALNASCVGSACAAVPAIKALFQDALDSSTLYIGPEPCSLFQQLNGSALLGLEPVWNASQKTGLPQQACAGVQIERVPVDELASAILSANSSAFELVLVADTLEKLVREEVQGVISAIARRAKGPVLAVVGSVKQANTGLQSGPREKQGLELYETATWWVEAFAAENLIEARAKSPFLEEARANLTGGELLHLVQAGGGEITEESGGKALQARFFGRLSAAGVSNTAAEEDADATLEEDGRSEHGVAASKGERLRGTGGGLRPAAQPSDWWAFLGAPLQEDRTTGGKSAAGELQRGSVGGGVNKPALGLASRAREAAHEEREGGRLQEVLEREALAQELEPKRVGGDLVTLAGSETESGVTSMDTAEDRKALNKRLPEVAKLAVSGGPLGLRARRALGEKGDERLRQK